MRNIKGLIFLVVSTLTCIGLIVAASLAWYVNNQTVTATGLNIVADAALNVSIISSPSEESCYNGAMGNRPWGNANAPYFYNAGDITIEYAAQTQGAVSNIIMNISNLSIRYYAGTITDVAARDIFTVLIKDGNGVSYSTDEEGYLLNSESVKKEFVEGTYIFTITIVFLGETRYPQWLADNALSFSAWKVSLQSSGTYAAYTAEYDAAVLAGETSVATADEWIRITYAEQYWDYITAEQEQYRAEYEEAVALGETATFSEWLAAEQSGTVAACYCYAPFEYSHARYTEAEYALVLDCNVVEV